MLYSKRKVRSTLFLFFSLCFINTVSSQEIRGLMGIQVYGDLTGAFVGPGIGIESDLGKHFTINSDFTIGFQEVGTAFQFKPAVHFYFRQDNKGFFIGPSFKYVSLNEKNNLDNFVDDIYTVGFSLGLKSTFKNRFNYFISSSPHYAVGSSTGTRNLGGVAGISFNVGLAYKL